MRRIILAIVAALTAIAANANDFVLNNGLVKLRFSDGEKYLFKEFSVGGINYLPEEGSRVAPWTLTLKGPHGVLVEMEDYRANYKGGVLSDDGKSVTFTWTVKLEKQECPARATVTLPDNSELPEWTFTFEGIEGWNVNALNFPRVHVATPKDAYLILPRGYGVKRRLEGCGSYYPSSACGMNMVMVSGSYTIYFAALDKTGQGKTYNVFPAGDKILLRQYIVTQQDWTVNGKFELPWPTTISFNKGTWQQTALKWYRPYALSTPWGEKTIRERTLPDWIKNIDFWIQANEFTQSTFENVKRLLYLSGGKGVGIHWYSWQHSMHDRDYPDYYPYKPGFDAAVKTCQSMGARVTPYTNGRLWDIDSPSFKEKHLENSLCRREDGSAYSEIYYTRSVNSVACPATGMWKDILIENNCRVMTDIGTDGLYIDQVGCSRSQSCYDSSHNHPLGNGDWWPGAIRETIPQVRKACCTKEQILSTEENVECYCDLFDMNLIVNNPVGNGNELVPLFPLIYSDRFIYSGYCYVPGTVNNGSLRLMLRNSLLWGSQPGWVRPEILLRDENENELKMVENIFKFRRDQDDIFDAGRYLEEIAPKGDNPVIDVPGFWKTPAVLGARWQTTEMEEVIILANMDEYEHEVKLADGRKIPVPAYGAVRIPGSK